MPTGLRRRSSRPFTQTRTRESRSLHLQPVVGATLGAAVPPEGYAARMAEICRKNGILLIADEVMTGMGRTGNLLLRSTGTSSRT